MKALHRNSLLLGAAVALLGAGVALPTHASSQVEQLPEVRVEAGAINGAVVGRSVTTNAPIQSTTVDYRVRHDDLDLTRHADVLALQERVEAAARSACGQLDELFPLDSSYQQTRTCAQDAIRGAAQQVRQAIASAQEHADEN